MKHNPLTIMTPERAPTRRTRLSTPESPDHDRIFRALSRLACWQCPSCSEIFPTGHKSFLSVCSDCWINNESLDEVIDFDKVTNLEISKLYMLFYREWGLYNRLAPHGNRNNERSPFEWDCLHVLQTWIGDDRIKDALSDTQAHDVKLYFRADSCKWTPDGLVPYRAPNHLPDTKDYKAWDAIKKLAFENLP